MKITLIIYAVVCLFGCEVAAALEADEILVVANRDSKESMKLASYYCARRKVPVDQVLALPLGAGLADAIGRGDARRLRWFSGQVKQCALQGR